MAARHLLFNFGGFLEDLIPDPPRHLRRVVTALVTGRLQESYGFFRRLQSSGILAQCELGAGKTGKGSRKLSGVVECLELLARGAEVGQ